MRTGRKATNQAHNTWNWMLLNKTTRTRPPDQDHPNKTTRTRQAHLQLLMKIPKGGPLHCIGHPHTQLFLSKRFHISSRWYCWDKQLVASVMGDKAQYPNKTTRKRRARCLSLNIPTINHCEERKLGRNVTGDMAQHQVVNEDPNGGHPLHRLLSSS